MKNLQNIQRIYISGPITGVSGYMEHFAGAEKKITAAGYEAVNPAKTIAQLPETLTWEECMQICFAMLDICDAIYLMEGWKDSKGAAAELKHAMEKGKAILCRDGCCRMYTEESIE